MKGIRIYLSVARFYDNCRNSRAYRLILIVKGHKFIIYAMREQASADSLTFRYRKNLILSSGSICPAV